MTDAIDAEAQNLRLARWTRRALAIAVAITAVVLLFDPVIGIIALPGRNDHRVLAAVDCGPSGPWRSAKVYAQFYPARSTSSHGYGGHLSASVRHDLVIESRDPAARDGSVSLLMSDGASNWHLLSLMKREYLARCDGKSVGVSDDGGATWWDYEPGASGWPQRMNESSN